MLKLAIVMTFTACLLGTRPTEAKEVCTLIMDQNAVQVLHQAGDCSSRVTPASTFKIALAVMGFDAGVLQDAHSPRMAFQEGFPDWGGYNWRQPTDPERWMKYSVVWFSRQITPLLGIADLTDYAASFGYGNANFSGDYAQSNGLDRAWMSSSLKISPREQVGFLSRMINGGLAVSPQAIEKTVEIVEFADTKDGWRIWGKSGTAYPRQDTGSFDYAKGWGWFVGWATRGETTVVFAHLLKDNQRHEASPGVRAKTRVLNRFDTLIAQGG